MTENSPADFYRDEDGKDIPYSLYADPIGMDVKIASGVCGAFFIVLLIFSYLGSRKLKRLQLEYRVLYLFTFVISLKLAAFALYFLYYLVNINISPKNIGIFIVANYWDLIARSSMILLLLFIAQGWLMSRHYPHAGVPGNPLTPIVIFISLVVTSIVFYMVPSFTYFNMLHRPFPFSTLTGGVLIGFFTFAMLWFDYTCMNSITHHHDDHQKQVFFKCFGTIFTTWQAVLPVSVLIINFASKWHRQGAFMLTTMFSDLLFYLFFFLIFRPSIHNPNVQVVVYVNPSNSSTTKTYEAKKVEEEKESKTISANIKSDNENNNNNNDDNNNNNNNNNENKKESNAPDGVNV